MREFWARQLPNGQDRQKELTQVSWTWHQEKRNSNDHVHAPSENRKGTKLNKISIVGNFSQKRFADNCDIIVDSGASEHVIADRNSNCSWE